MPHRSRLQSRDSRFHRYATGLRVLVRDRAIYFLDTILRRLTRDPAAATRHVEIVIAHARTRYAADHHQDLHQILPTVRDTVGHLMWILDHAYCQAADLNTDAGRRLGDSIDELSWAAQSIADAHAHLTNSND